MGNGFRSLLSLSLSFPSFFLQNTQRIKTKNNTSLEPKVFPAHQRKLLDTVAQLAFPSTGGDAARMASRLVRMTDPDKISFACRAYLAEARARNEETDPGLLVEFLFSFWFSVFALCLSLSLLSRSSPEEKKIDGARRGLFFFFFFLGGGGWGAGFFFCLRTNKKKKKKKKFAFLNRYNEHVTPDFIAQRAQAEQDKAEALAAKAEEAAAREAEKEERRAMAAAKKRQKTAAA